VSSVAVAGVVDPGIIVAISRGGNTDPGLERPLACIIIKFNLSSSEAAHHTPTVAPCEVSHRRLRHFSQNSQLRRLRNNVLRPAW